MIAAFKYVKKAFNKLHKQHGTIPGQMFPGSEDLQKLMKSGFYGKASLEVAGFDIQGGYYLKFKP